LGDEELESEMRVFPIGVGTAFGRRFFNTNLIVELHSGEFLLVDCGLTASRSLETIGMSILDVDHLYVSHLHADHIGGIEELALKRKLVLNKRVNLYINAKLVDSLWGSIREGLEYTQLGRLRIDDYFNVLTYDDHFSLDGIEFTSHPTHHIKGMKSFDIGFDDFLVTTDTVFSAEYVRSRAAHFGTVVHDCSFNSVQKVHAYYERLIEHRDLFRKLYVIHYEDSIERYRRQLEEAGIGICHQYAAIVDSRCR
jgi:glyoxylase-like metal-dependent hydrolase (beta-lactamase superfamily II)